MNFSYALWILIVGMGIFAYVMVRDTVSYMGNDGIDWSLIGILLCLIGVMAGLVAIGYAVLMIEGVMLRWFVFGLYLIIVGGMVASAVIEWDKGGW